MIINFLIIIQDNKMYNDYLILPAKSKKKVNNYEKVAVIIYVFYEYKLDYYFKYIKEIPEGIHIYIITSNENIMNDLYSKIVRNKKNIEIRVKNNRGRDISALLIASRDILSNYEYVCFIHDKAYKTQDMKEDTEIWENNTWQNILCNKGYINEIFSYFKTNSEIGLMIPPAPYSKNIPRWYTNSWQKNYHNTEKLLKQIGCNIEIDYNMFPISIGTNFWVRTKAIEKLYKYNWKYEDFDDEPLKNDGTISHAIERSLSFIVKDSGFTTKIIMNNEWAQNFLSILQQDLVKTFQIIGNQYGIRSLSELSYFTERENELKKFVSPENEVYIYGAGDRAQDCNKCLKRLNIHIRGYLVTDNVDADEMEKIYCINSINDKDIKIVIAVSINYRNQIVSALTKKGMFNYFVY